MTIGSYGDLDQPKLCMKKKGPLKFIQFSLFTFSENAHDRSVTSFIKPIFYVSQPFPHFFPDILQVLLLLPL